MARCEDYPCCGHEPGRCPDYDEGGRQLNMRCTCGAVLSITSRYSICDTCLNMPDPSDPYDDHYYDGPDYNDEDLPYEGPIDD